MSTVDANVWVAGFDTTDVSHTASAAFFHEADRRGVLLYVPAYALVEVACVLARRYRDPALGATAAARIGRRNLVRVIPVNEVLVSAAMQIGSQQFLRAGDALYAATAQVTGSTLVSWDQELIRRAGAVSPADWLNSGTGI
jgi:predicted nucleic acid-binding protein